MTIRIQFLFVVFLMALWSVPTASGEDDWNRFRGPNGSGISTSTNVVTNWSEGENIRWQTELPGPGSSSPIVSGDKVFVTCYSGFGVDKSNPGDARELKRHLICLDRESGKEMWRASVDGVDNEDAYKGFITDHGYASSTPVSDGQLVFAFFGKSGVLACDMDGKKIWHVSVGTKSDPAKWGGGASPVLYKGMLIVNAGIEGHALIALNKSDGSEAWRIDDEKFTNSWSTPILAQVGDDVELIHSVPDRLIGIDPANGQQLWHAKSPIKNAITASVVVDDGIVYTLGGRQGRAVAIRCGGRGDVSDTHTVWTVPVPSSIGTPLAFDGHLYWLAQGNIMMCLSLKDGSEVNKVRLKSAGNAGSYASPILVGDKMLIVTRTGTTHVLSVGPELNKISESSFEGDKGQFDGTPAIAAGQMFVRSDQKLYCVATKD